MSKSVAGGDLHNLDAFIFLFAVFASYILAGHLHFESEDNAIPNEQNMTPVWQAKPFWLAIAVIVPVFFAFMRGGAHGLLLWINTIRLN